VHWRLDGPSELDWAEKSNSVVQYVASYYTECASPSHPSMQVVYTEHVSTALTRGHAVAQLVEVLCYKLQATRIFVCT
jgi:hypothetical protein